MDLCTYSSILLLVSWRIIHEWGGSKAGDRGQGTIERDETKTEGLLYYYIYLLML